MTIKEIYKSLPTEKAAVSLLESIYWDSVPKCPYCGSTQATPFSETKRYKCNTCENSFSVTVKTMFHRTKVEIQNWIYLLLLMSEGKPIPSLRTLSEEMGLSKDTVSKMIHRIKSHYIQEKETIDKLINRVSNGK